VRPLRVAIAGAGAVARAHAATLDDEEHADLAAVCDPVAARAEALARPRGAPAYAAWDEMLARESPDVLLVCTPPAHHRAPAEAALAAGVHVYLEKPIAHTAGDGEAIAAAAARSRALCGVGYQWRASPLVGEVRTLVEATRVEMLVGVNYGPVLGRPWFLDPAQGGGQILERASHHIDLQRVLAGEVAEVSATAGTIALAQAGPVAIADAVSLVLRFEDGAIGSVHSAWTRDGQPGRFGVDIVAGEAVLGLELGPDRHLLTGACRGEPIDSVSTDPLGRSLGRFLDAVRAGDPGVVACPPDEALRTLRVALACERSLAEDATVTA
jgi:predicted dehydrogenase